MKNLLNIIIFVFLVSFLNSCSGSGGEDSGSTSNNVVSNSATFNENAKFISEDTISSIVAIEKNSSNEGHITFDDAQMVSTWQEDDIKVLPPSDNIKGGLAIKVKEVINTSSGSKVTYSTPAIDEVFQSMRIKIDTAVKPSMLKSINLAKGANLKLSYANKKSKSIDSISARSWFPGGINSDNEIVGGNGNLIEKFSFSLNTVIYKNEAKNEKIVLSGKIDISNMNIFFDFDNTLIPPKIYENFHVEYDLSQNINLSASLELEANASDFVPSNFQCGRFNIESELGGVDVNITGASFEKTDICLGSFSLELSAVPIQANIGSKDLTPSPVALKIYLILGANMKVSIKSSIELSKNSYNKKGMILDSTSDKKFQFINTESISKTNTALPTWKKNIQGEIDGEIKIYAGIAPAIEILGINPVVMRAYAGPTLRSTASASYGDGNLDGCFDIDFGLDYGFGAQAGLKASLEIDTFFTKVNTSFGYIYKYKLEKELSFYDYNSCEQTGYEITFLTTPTNNSHFDSSNIQIIHDGEVITFDNIIYMVYDQNNQEIYTGDDLSNITLSDGYTIKSIITIDANNGIKTSIVVNIDGTNDEEDENQENGLVVLKTGQTESYKDGDDGYYQNGQERIYTRDDDLNIVTDHVTNLMWQDANIVSKQWLTQEAYDAGDYDDTSGDTATTYCDDLVFGTFDNWRLPTKIELQSLVDYGTSNPSTNLIFEDIPTSGYWSSSLFASHTNLAWIISFYNGSTTISHKNDSYLVRCARTGQ